jgi:PIN domain nuclease of toxin-antitoxin system
MRFLLDTHTFIWFIEGSDKLPVKLVKEIKDTSNDCYVSIASLWEIAIKMSTGKLKLELTLNDLETGIGILKLQILPLSFNHINKVHELDYHHRDPFDRMIIAQSITEDLTIISKDKNFSLYPIKLLW